MKRRWTGLLALLAVFVLGACAAAFAVGRSSSAGHRAQSHATMHSVATATASAAAAKGTTVRTLETDLTIQPGSLDGSSGKCPKKAPHAIGGYWGTDDATREGDLVNIRSSPIGSGGHRWEVALKNTSLTPVVAYVGTVCIK